MIYEIVVICIVIYLYTSKQKNKFKNYRSNLKLTGSIYIYILLIMVAFLLYIIYPGANNLLSFFNIESTGSSRIEEDLSTTAMIVRQILISATIFGYVLCLNYLYSEYKRNNSVIYVYASIFISLIQVSIIIGERRSFQLYTTFAVLFLLLTLYKKHKKKIAIWVLVTAGTVLIGMSIYKFFYAFEYDSYIEAIMKSNSQSSDIANYLQLYLLGPQNIAKSIEFTANISPSISNLFYDVSRSILGISFLVKDIGMPTSTNLFNTYIYGGLTSTGHIISSIGYGYMYFGYILAPFFSATIIVFALFIETKLKNTSSFEYAYLLAYILIRSILGVFTAITALLNVVSLMLISVGLVYFSARVTKVLLLKQRNNNWRIRRENIYD
ncbi:hypothetical protein [Halobacillus mangrovi]|uniref:hypothetical protein n=1 Tax=Halobacillus mangrovi TaxID=402384 RepID=UPI003D972116